MHYYHIYNIQKPPINTDGDLNAELFNRGPMYLIEIAHKFVDKMPPSHEPVTPHLGPSCQHSFAIYTITLGEISTLRYSLKINHSSEIDDSNTSLVYLVNTSLY